MSGIVWALTLFVCAGVDGECRDVDLAVARTHAACEAAASRLAAWQAANPHLLLVDWRCEERIVA